MSWLPRSISALGRFLGSARFAVLALLAFAVAMIWGTLVESRHGAEYAGRLVYQSPVFYAIQGAIFLAVTVSVLHRIPLRRRLAGFYVVHAAIVVVLVGSLVTRGWGIDGTVELRREVAESTASLGIDVLQVFHRASRASLELPELASRREFSSLGLSVGGAEVRVREMIPYAKSTLRSVPRAGVWVSRWRLSSPRATTEFDLASRTTPYVASLAKLGRMSVRAVPYSMYAELRRLMSAPAPGAPALCVLDSVSSESACLAQTGRASHVRLGGEALAVGTETDRRLGLEYVRLRAGKSAELRFFPKYSPHPILRHDQVDSGSRYEVHELEEWSAGEASVLVSVDGQGRMAIAYGKGREWSFASPWVDTEAKLPWMGFTLSRLEFSPEHEKLPDFVETSARSESFRNLQAARIEVARGAARRSFWVSTLEPAELELDGERFAFELRKKELKFPFALTLREFRMSTNPGTRDPASYESFVRVGTGSGEESVHIHMNHPYKRDGLTFYQASYAEEENGGYRSVLSVNRDPGRPIKYFGTFLLVLGMLLHYRIIHRRKATP